MPSFRARARTVDLLGRQQIAGIPTAISELFKNAHDAYADHVEADYLRDDDLFVLRDDGVGMSAQDFADRWLVLATESKVRGQAPRPEPRPGYLPRPVLGEKGIGRLAIAAIGPALLVLTRRLSADGTAPVVAAFLHWGIFEVPGINLDQIDVPVEEFPDVPDRQRVRVMVDAFAANLAVLPDDVDPDLVSRIRAGLATFDVDPAALDAALPGPSLRRDGSGTHFFVAPPSESLAAVLKRGGSDRASDLQTTLIGFADTMLPDSPEPAIRTAFRDHRDGAVFDLLAPGEFFTADEFRAADHRVVGAVRGDGTFVGEVSIYGQEPVPYTLAWPSGAVQCGPFELHLAVVQPEAESSNITATALKAMRLKMTRLGGLYVYRDGIRILPYGRPENDWLGIEQERSKHAGRAFWSHRRMFGEVTLRGGRNAALEEKAGREGFRDNRAYREFREVLMYLLRNIATDFFVGSGAQAEAFRHAKEELKRKARARAEREKQAAARRAAFARRLESIEQLVESGDVQLRVEAVLDDLRAMLDAATGGDAVLAAERRARAALASIAHEVRVERPRGFGMDSDLRAAWSAHQAAAESLESAVFVPAASRVAVMAQDAMRRLSAPPAPRQRLAALVSDTSERVGAELAQREREAREALDGTSRAVEHLLDDALRSFKATVDRAMAEIAAGDIDGDLEVRRRAAEEPIVAAGEREGEALESVAAQLRAVRAARNGAGLQLSELEAMDAMEEELLVLQERNAAELELAQLGLGIQIVGHEFNASVAAVRDALRRLKPWVDANEGLRRPYQDLRSGFEHLEGYLRLLSPLQRRLNRRRSRIRGREIADYLEQLFGTRLKRDRVGLRASKAFASHEVVAYRSTIYPAFVALVDNALFWVREGRGERWIRLDAEGDSLIVTNSGPPVPPRDRERIFELGFSRKPGGQGTGLFVVRESLAAQGFDIDVIDREDGWAFRISPQAEQK